MAPNINQKLPTLRVADSKVPNINPELPTWRVARGVKRREAGVEWSRKKKHLAEDRGHKYKDKKRTNAENRREKYRNQGWWREMKGLAEGSPRHPANVTGKRTKTQRAMKNIWI